MSVPDQGANHAAPAGIELSAAVRSQLLDPSLWREGLEKYALATNLAVTLTDADGRRLGEYINAQPTWSLLHTQMPADSGTCPFSLVPHSPCTCIGDALAKGGLCVARDRTGLLHFAVPLLLGEHRLGALVAGQVFDQFPEELVLEHAAKQLGFTPQEVWHLARLEHPVRQVTLRVYAGLLATLAGNLLHSRYHAITEASRLAEMTRLSEALRQRTRELSEASHRKDEFLAMLAHELRNPLAPMRNGVQVMRLLAQDNAKLRRAGEVVERQLKHLSRLVDDLLDVSRFTSGKITLQKEPTDLAAVVARAVEAVRPAIEERCQELSIAPPSERVRVEADPVRLAQVLGNLLNNAAKYTPEGGRIWLTAGPEDGEAVVRVRDTGIGIPADMLNSIFDLFTQVGYTIDRSHGGLGIGLTLVKSLIELHGGSVQAFSAGPDQGSEFVVRLPLLPDTQQLEETKEESESHAAPSPPRRILVVEDNADEAESLAQWLELTGHHVQIAPDGPAALEAARATRPEVVLLDIGLPRMDGYEVARRLRKQPETEHALLVALTGYGQEADRRRCQAAGFDHHLVKPADLDTLQRLLAQTR